MNGNLLKSGLIDDIFVHPLSADVGMPIASAMTLEYLNGNETNLLLSMCSLDLVTMIAKLKKL